MNAVRVASIFLLTCMIMWWYLVVTNETSFPVIQWAHDYMINSILCREMHMLSIKWCLTVNCAWAQTERRFKKMYWITLTPHECQVRNHGRFDYLFNNFFMKTTKHHDRMFSERKSPVNYNMIYLTRSTWICVFKSICRVGMHSTSHSHIVKHTHHSAIETIDINEVATTVWNPLI